MRGTISSHQLIKDKGERTATKLVTKHLGKRYGLPFANHWDFVRYAKEQRLDLDFTAPPKQPARP